MSYSSEYADRLRRLQALASLGVSAQALSRPASKTDLANLILQKARSDFSVSEPISMPEKPKKNILQKGKSVALGILDVLSRPSYAVASAADEGFNDPNASIGSVVKAAGKGLAGHSDTSFIDVLQHQHINDIKKRPEYERILRDYGQNEANYYAESEKKLIDSGELKDVIPGTINDFVFDPLNAVGAGLLKKPFDAIKGVSKAASGLSDLEALGEGAAKLGREEPTSLATEAVQSLPSQAQELPPATNNLPAGLTKSPETLSPGILGDVQFASTQPGRVELPKIPFASPKRPNKSIIEDTEVNALRGKKLQGLLEAVNTNPKFATLDHVFNKDISANDYAGLTKARVVNESAQVVDQAGKGSPSALEFLATKRPGTLTPVAQKLVDDAIERVTKEIKESIADPVRAKAAGKQPRHPIFNAPTQNNLSNKLTTAARKQFEAESMNPRTGKGVTKGASPTYIPAV